MHVPGLVLLLPLTLAVPLATSGASAQAVGESEVKTWLDLDNEIRAVRSQVGTGAQRGLRWGGVVRAFYTFSEERPESNEDISGFDLDDADLFFEYNGGDFGARVSMDFDDGDGELEDAFAMWRTDESNMLSVGQFKPRVLRSNAVDPEKLLFRDRTILGTYFDRWDTGVELQSTYDQFQYWFSLSNGETGQLEDHLFVIRAEWDLYERDELLQEGSRGAPDYLIARLGGVWFKDTTKDGNTRGAGADLVLMLGPNSLHVEYFDLHDVPAGTTVEVGDALLRFEDDLQPFAVTYSQLLSDQVEIAGRYQRFERDRDTESWGGVVRWTPTNSNLTWLAEYVDYSTDQPNEGFVASIGVVFGMTR